MAKRKEHCPWFLLSIRFPCLTAMEKPEKGAVEKHQQRC